MFEDDKELRQIVAELSDWGFIVGDVQFADREELGKFLIEQQGKIRAGKSLNLAERVVLDRALGKILGRSIF